MSTCVVLFIVAWSVVRLWSVPAAVGMCVVAMMIPPIAAIVANRRGPEDRWFDEDDTGATGDKAGAARRKPPERGPGRTGPDVDAKPTGTAKDPAPPKPPKEGKRRPPVVGDSGDPESDAWWAELEDRNRRDRRE